MLGSGCQEIQEPYDPDVVASSPPERIRDHLPSGETSVDLFRGSLEICCNYLGEHEHVIDEQLGTSPGVIPAPGRVTSGTEPAIPVRLLFGAYDRRTPVVYEFADFQLDTAQRQLRRADIVLHLTPKAYQLLLLLVERRPQVLSKSEIQDLLWPDAFVTESTLAALVAEIRRTLQDQARDARFIRTAHGFGYGFCGAAMDRGARNGAIIRSAFSVIDLSGREHALHEGDNLVGRDLLAEVRIDEHTVSRRHALIRVSDGSATLEDLASKNGTAVNGVQASTTTRIGPGDILSFGGVDVVFRWSADHTSTLTLHETERGRRPNEEVRDEETASAGDSAFGLPLAAPETERQ